MIELRGPERDVMVMLMRARDTSPEAHAAQVAVLRRLGPNGRFALSLQMIEEMDATQRVAIRNRHPEYTEREVWFAQVRLRLGHELFTKAWPDGPFLDP